MNLKEIPITDIENIHLGQTEDPVGGTGCTVLYCAEGMAAGLDVRGGGPASRETELLKPVSAVRCIHAVVLAGGSAFGLDAAGGVMRYLEEQGIGYDVGVAKVPLVCQSDIFDLAVGDVSCRPDPAMGYRAAQAAAEGNYRDGCYGAGCGATVGKLRGGEYCMKSGIGSYAVQVGDLKVGAVVAVNALGDIFDPDTGKQIAGMLNAEKTGLVNSEEAMYEKTAAVENRFTGNTTIGIVVTNGAFQKTELSKIAAMAHNGYARAICPVHTTADGDSIYAVSVGTVNADQDVVGTLAARVMSRAIVRAAEAAEGAFGHPAMRDLK